ncbi:MAG TPA: energy-coupling factor transporter transmembrane component T [Galbitalea sp.]|nr:energy-coupling factor transporter transmembrane component T [Galbitalea sp.]
MSAAILRINPVAKIAAGLLIGLVLVLTLDWVSGVVALVLEAAVLPFAGVSWRAFWLRTAPVWIAAPLVSITVALYGRASGHVYFSWLLANVTDGSLALALATGIRILAIALPAIVLFITVDPTDLADGLAQVLRLPSRFVLGSLAALRLVGMFLDDWRSLELARRARGVGDRNPIRRLFGQLFALLVLSIRRGSKLATAMEARGFGAPITRTWARPSSFGWPEIVLLLIGAGIAAVAIGASVLAGTWSFFGAR